MADLHFLHDIKLERNNAATTSLLVSPMLAPLLYEKGLEVVRLYQARVGKKTRRLRDSAASHPPEIGGRNNDRFIGKVTVGGETTVTPWKGGEFNYGEYHEEGTRKTGRRRRTVTGRDGYHELRQVAQEWRQT